MVAVDVEPAQGVLLVLDPFEGGEPFDDRMAVEGSDAMAKETVRLRVNHIVLDGRQIDHPSVLVAGDPQIGNQGHLVSVERSAVNLIGS